MVLNNNFYFLKCGSWARFSFETLSNIIKENKEKGALLENALWNICDNFWNICYFALLFIPVKY
jgi:hypothetical protein